MKRILNKNFILILSLFLTVFMPVIYLILCFLIYCVYIDFYPSPNNNYSAVAVYASVGPGYNGQFYLVDKTGIIPKIERTEYDAPGLVEWINEDTVKIHDNGGIEGILNLSK